MPKATSRRDFLRKSSVLVAAGMSNPLQINAATLARENLIGEKPVGIRESKATSSAWVAPQGPGAAEELKRFTEEERQEEPKWLGWWRDTLLRVDFDMIMTDASLEALARIDPEDIVATSAAAGFQGLWGYVLDPSGWCYYPSKIWRQFPTLKGRDLVAEFIAACRKHNLRYLGYYDPLEFGLATREHPEWRTEFVGDRIPSSPRLWGKLCFNRPGCFDFVLSILQESVTLYDMDAVFLDDYELAHCGCADCQIRYKAETSRELPFYETPEGEDYPDKLGFGHNYPNRPEFGYYFCQLQIWLADWAMRMREAVKKIRPDCLVLFQYGWGFSEGGDVGYSVKMAEATDVTGRDAIHLGYQYQHSLDFKCLRSFTPYPPCDLEIGTAEHHGDETSPKQEGLLKQQLAYALAHGGSVTYIDDLDWQGRISKKKHERTKKVNAWCRERFPYLGGVMVADVGLYVSHESHVYHPQFHHWRWSNTRGDVEAGLKFSIHHTGNEAFTQAMIREHVPFDVVHRNKLKELARHKVMYLSNVEVMREEEGNALREFVREGGGLVITCRSGLRDEQFQERTNFLLADLMGADYLETPSLATSFVAVQEKDRTEGFFTEVDQEISYFEVHGPQCYVKPREGALPLGQIARPRRPYMEEGGFQEGTPPTMQLIDPQEIPQANAGYRYEAEITTDHPSIVLNKFGKGRVAYCAAHPFYDCVDSIHDLIVSLVNWAAGGNLDPTVSCNSFPAVEIITMEQLSKKRTVVHAVNWQTTWPAIRAHDIDVGVKRFGRKAKRALALEAKSELRFREEHDRIRLGFPPFESWETVVIEWV